MSKKFSRLSVDDYYDGIVSGDRMILSRAITLVESTLSSDKTLANNLIERILHLTGNAKRIGITGVPGVGKSTFIESYGRFLSDKNETIAVLTIDPSSTKSKGSILGDKTRMDELSRTPGVFIRPSAAGEALGGVGNATREAMLLCEAAGYSTIFIETVGVGQSEISVKNMVDFFLLLMLSGAGDELQGIKKGIMEMADAIVITKADGQNVRSAQRAKQTYENALHLFPPDVSGWQPKVLIASAQEKTGFEEINSTISKYFTTMQQTGHLENIRNTQKLKWFEDVLQSLQLKYFMDIPNMKKNLVEKEQLVLKGLVSPFAAAHELMKLAK